MPLFSQGRRMDKHKLNKSTYYGDNAVRSQQRVRSAYNPFTFLRDNLVPEDTYLPFVV